jgi:MoxR-like ATPase
MTASNARDTITPPSVANDLDALESVRSAVARVVVGQEEVVDQILISLLCGGHVLVEGAPGLGKTLLVRTLADACGLAFSRIQFTPDLMPADITGTIALFTDERGQTSTKFQPGPIFAQLVLTDEVNRATPKTQSALLEAMQERTVTVAGKPYPLPAPFFVLATQNPIEMEGTYVLPEAQVDRFFFKVDIPFPSEEVLDQILALTTTAENPETVQALSPDDLLRLQRTVREVPIADHVRRTVARFVLSTQPDQPGADEDVVRYVRFGVSPRGAQALILAAKAHALLDGRFAVAFDDLKAVALPALRHRFQLNYEADAAGRTVEPLLTRLLARAIAAAA